MTKNTEPKTRTPLIRMATGIAAAAAVLGVTGGFGYLLMSVKNDVQTSNVATQIEEQTIAQYPAWFSEYYEARTGHPVDFDFLSITGTDLDETWEFDTSTVHLVAAISDGWTLNYLYTVTPKGEWECTTDMVNDLPYLEIVSDGDPELQGGAGKNVSNAGLIDRELREDGSLLCLGTVRADHAAMPLLGNAQCYANCYEHTSGYHIGNNDHPISFNIPAEKAECRPLVFSSGTETLEAPVGQDGECCTYTHSVVTPLGIILTNFDTNDMAEWRKAATAAGSVYISGSTGRTVAQDAITAMKAIHAEDEPQPAAITYGDVHSEFAAVGDYALYEVAYSDEADVDYNTCWLPFTEPQKLDNVMFMQLYTPESLAENKLAACAEVNPETDAEPEVVEVPAEDAEDDQPVSTDYPAFDSMSEQERTREFDFGTVTLKDLVYVDGGNLSAAMEVCLNDDVQVADGEELQLRFTPVGYDDEGNRYEIRNEQVQQGAVWTVGTPAAAPNRYTVQLVLEPLSKKYYYTQNAAGEWVSAMDDDAEPVYWEYLDIELNLNAVTVRGADAASYSWENWDTVQPWRFRSGLAPFKTAFSELSAEQRSRTFDFGTVTLDDLTYEDGVPVLHYSYQMDYGPIPADEYVVCQILPIGMTEDDTVIFNIDESAGAQVTAEEAGADGRYHFTMPLVPEKGTLPDNLAVDVRLSLLLIGDAATSDVTTCDITAPEEGGMYHICRFTL